MNIFQEMKERVVFEEKENHGHHKERENGGG